MGERKDIESRRAAGGICRATCKLNSRLKLQGDSKRERQGVARIRQYAEELGYKRLTGRRPGEERGCGRTMERESKRKSSWRSGSANSAGFWGCGRRVKG